MGEDPDPRRRRGRRTGRTHRLEGRGTDRLLVVIDRGGNGTGDGRIGGQRREQRRDRPPICGNRRRHLPEERGNLVGEGCGPVGMTPRDPPGRLTDARVTVSATRNDVRLRQRRLWQSVGHLVEGHKRRALRRRGARRERRAEGSGRGGLNQRIGDRVIEGPIVGTPSRGQKRLTGPGSTETAEGFGCSAGHRRCVVDDDVPQRLERRGVAMEAHDMAGRLADTGVRIAKAGANGPAGFVPVDPGQCPESLLADGGGRRCREQVTDRRHRGGVQPGEGIGGPGDDGGARVGEERGEVCRGHSPPVESAATRIGNRRRPLAADTVNGAEDRRLLEL